MKPVTLAVAVALLGISVDANAGLLAEQARLRVLVESADRELVRS